jgi:hypothetical protein
LFQKRFFIEPEKIEGAPVVSENKEHNDVVVDNKTE